MQRFHSKSRAGFTLAEILLAMLVFSIAITTILALLARSIETADEILLKNEAIDLSSALESYLSEESFIDTYDLIQSAQPDEAVVYAFRYRAVPGDDSELTPFVGDLTASSVGQQFVEASAIRETVTANEDTARTGRLFHVKLSESPANPFAAENGGTGNLPADPNAAGGGGMPAYDSAVLVIYAEFFPIPASGASPPPEPVFAFNLAVRR